MKMKKISLFTILSLLLITSCIDIEQPSNEISTGGEIIPPSSEVSSSEEESSSSDSIIEEHRYESINIESIGNAFWTDEPGRDDEKLSFYNDLEAGVLNVSYDRSVIGEWACIQIYFKAGAFEENKKFSLDLELVSGELSWLVFDLDDGISSTNNKKYARQINEGETNISISLANGKTDNPTYLLIFVNEPTLTDSIRPINYPEDYQPSRTGIVEFNIKSIRLEVDDLPENPDDADPSDEEENDGFVDGVKEITNSVWVNETETDKWFDITKNEDNSTTIKWDTNIVTSNWANVQAFYDATKVEGGNKVILDMELVKGDLRAFEFAFGYDANENEKKYQAYKDGRATYEFDIPENKKIGEIVLKINSPWEFNDLEKGEVELVIYSLKIVKVETNTLNLGFGEIISNYWTTDPSETYDVTYGENGETIIKWDAAVLTSQFALVVTPMDLSKKPDATKIIIDMELKMGGTKAFNVKFGWDDSAKQVYNEFANGRHQYEISLDGITSNVEVLLQLNSPWNSEWDRTGMCEVVIYSISLA